MYLENEYAPSQAKGKQTDMIEHIRLNSENDAEEFYKNAQGRLLNMWNWNKIADDQSSEFQLTDKEGKPVSRPAQRGDKFKMDLRSQALFGEYIGWVEVVDIEDEFDPFENIAVTAIKVVPTADPTNAYTKNRKFYTGDASSTFLVKRIGQVVSAEIHSRNQAIANKGMQFIGAVRHVVGTIAARLGFPMSEWKRLAKGLLGISAKEFVQQRTMLANGHHKAVA